MSATEARSAPPPQHGAVGAQLARIDGPLKVKGAARFAAEVPFENLTYVALVYSTIARGRIAELDVEEASLAPGVVLVMTHRNAPRLSPPALFNSAPRAAGASDLPVMQDDQVHWNGEPVALVLAETQEQADHAASLVRVAYEPVPAAVDFELERSKAHPPKSILGEAAKIEVADAEAALKTAAVVVDEIYETPRHNHNAIELHAATVAWEADRLTVHDATQTLHGTRCTLAGIFGVDESQIRILSPFVGGGFGGKTLWNHQILAIAAARLAGRPVRIVLSREGVFRIVGGRTLTRQRVALGAREDGKLSALIHTGCAGMTAHNDCPEQFTFPARHLYAADAMLISQEVVDLNMAPNTFMRAPGESVGTFALESAIDELAHAMELDPIELRARIEPDKDPTTGRPYSSRHIVEAYRRGAERFGWDQRNKTPGSRRVGEWLVGMGVATATYPYYRMPGGAARIRVSGDGHATVQMGSHEMGMGTATAQTQVTADRLGLPLDKVTFEYGDSDLPSGTIAGGSSQSASIIAAVNAAAEALTVELIQLAGNESHLAGLAPADVEARDGGLCRKDARDRWDSYTAILSRAGRSEAIGEADAPEPSEVDAWSMHSYGAQFCEARVSTVTGEVRISRFLGSFDTGRILNPRTAASQFRGGIVMGIGLALDEETLFDGRTGRIMNRSLASYHVPVCLDAPKIEVMWTDIPDPHSPMGVRGIGEIGITGVGAAVANAVFNATGRRIRSLPITLDKLL
ncbi:MAG: xanthine dehydrogenase family protein molybdopterin-binding subunit [Caulobacteraceae bacterium]|nr:xanthine dehydrogenase family protein molybdopterin-binding subunit [Caulobacteraceae bacterium]